MCDFPQEKLQERWKQPLQHLIVLGIVAPNRDAVWIFRIFFERMRQIDDFYFKTVGVAKYKELSFILKLLLTMSRSQATVEHGFNHSNAILKAMSTETVVSNRMIKNHMLSFNLKPHTIEITNPLIVAFKSSRWRYEVHLEEEKEKKEMFEADKKAMHTAADIDKLKVKRGQLERAMEMMESEFVECIIPAEDKYDLAYVHKGLELKRKSIETKDSMKVAEKETQELEEKKRKLLQ